MARTRVGRRPSPVTITKLRARATLATRPEKQTHSLAELTGQWRQRARRLLDEDAGGWAQRATATAMPLMLHADDVPLDVVARLGHDVVETVGEKRSTWRRCKLMAEAARQTMGWRFASTPDREAIIAVVVDAAEAASLRWTPPDLATSPAAFRRADESSVFRPHHSTVITSEELLAAEDRLLARSRVSTGPALPILDIEQVTQGPDHEGRLLSPDQAAALAQVAVSGRVVDVLIGSAGAGKTTAMNALLRAWEKVHGVGSVVGLAPSAVAAHVLAVDLGIGCENTAKWWHEHQAGRAGFDAGQLAIVDESSLAGTLSLDRITGVACEAGAKVLLVGDWAQMQAVDAGGAFSLLAHDRDDVPELVDVHRFTQPWEKTASLDLRHGYPDVIDTYIAHDRVRGGETEAMADAAYNAWRADTLDGRSSILLTESGEAMTMLNARAHADLILDGTVDARAEVRLRDDLAAGIGDIVITRRNDRRLRAGRSWGRNGERWTVAEVRIDGSIAIRPAGRPHGAALVLPAR